APAAKPAFEVIEDEPAAPVRPRARPVAGPIDQPQPAKARKVQEEDDVEFEVVEDEKPRKKAKPRRRDDDDEDDDDDERPRKKVKARSPEKELEDDDDRVRTRLLGVEEDDDDRPRPQKKKAKSKKPDHLAFEKMILNSGVPGGLAAMTVAAVWFIVALMNDWIFWYPPILFLVGLAAVIKALMGQTEEE
ncbi:MAG TPA: hypothetical protein VKE74_08435, partial [Gemmataceae bacterium]|nr:hypothetical protein [Gemmataceae bacterium]